MGYYERKATAEVVKGAAVICVVSLIAIWPWMVGKAIAGQLLAWTFETLYIAGIIWFIIAQVRKTKRTAALIDQEHLDFIQGVQAQQLATTPKFDPGVGFYSHGTCTIRHRSLGAAHRCHSTK